MGWIITIPPVPFAQATSPILDITTSYSTDAFPTNAHHTGASVLSFEATDDDEDFAQHARPCCDRCFPARLRTGDFVSTGSLRPSVHTRLLGPDFAPAHPALYLNDEDHTADNNSNSNTDIIDNASTISTTRASNVNANGSGSNTSNNITSRVNTTCTLNNGIDSNSNSKCAETASPIRDHPSITHNEHEHKRARMPHLAVSPQVPPFTSPPLDKPEEPPPAPPKDATPAAPTLRLCKPHAPLAPTPCTPFHIASG